MHSASHRKVLGGSFEGAKPVGFGHEADLFLVVSCRSASASHDKKDKKVAYNRHCHLPSPALVDPSNGVISNTKLGPVLHRTNLPKPT